MNFVLDPSAVHGVLRAILADGDRYGRSEEGKGKTVQVEFVSSNPTGPLTIGHLRQAALGDVLASLYGELGWTCVREYYLNDEGRQMELLAQSLWARYRQALGHEEPIPEGATTGTTSRRSGGARPGVGRRLPRLGRPGPGGLPGRGGGPDDGHDPRGPRSDRGPVRRVDPGGGPPPPGLVAQALERLRAAGAVYEKDGALWLSSTQHGLSRDVVLVRSDGTPTYTMVDIAYHLEKHARGFDLVVDVQGADHVDEQRQVALALRLLGIREGFLRYCLHQFVTLKGEEGIQRMSTRAGRFLRLKDLVAEVGRDVARYFMVMRKPESHLVFDFTLARDTSMENPVYYVQYAHTRIASLFREAARAGELPDDLLRVDLSPSSTRGSWR